MSQPLNGTSFLQSSSVCQTDRHRQADHAMCDICSNMLHLHVCNAWWCGLKTLDLTVRFNTTHWNTEKNYKKKKNNDGVPLQNTKLSADDDTRLTLTRVFWCSVICEKAVSLPNEHGTICCTRNIYEKSLSPFLSGASFHAVEAARCFADPEANVGVVVPPHIYTLLHYFPK